MEVDLVVTSRSHPTKLEVAFNTIIIFGGTKYSIPIQALALVEIRALFGGMTNSIVFYTIIKDKHTTLVVETSMEGGLITN